MVLVQALLEWTHVPHPAGLEVDTTIELPTAPSCLHPYLSKPGELERVGTGGRDSHLPQSGHPRRSCSSTHFLHLLHFLDLLQEPSVPVAFASVGVYCRRSDEPWELRILGITNPSWVVFESYWHRMSPRGPELEVPRMEMGHGGIGSPLADSTGNQD